MPTSGYPLPLLAWLPWNWNCIHFSFPPMPIAYAYILIVYSFQEGHTVKLAILSNALAGFKESCMNLIP